MLNPICGTSSGMGFLASAIGTLAKYMIAANKIKIFFICKHLLVLVLLALHTNHFENKTHGQFIYICVY